MNDEHDKDILKGLQETAAAMEVHKQTSLMNKEIAKSLGEQISIMMVEETAQRKIREDYPLLIPLLEKGLYNFVNEIGYDYYDGSKETIDMLVEYVENNEHMHSLWLL